MKMELTKPQIELLKNADFHMGDWKYEHLDGCRIGSRWQAFKKLFSMGLLTNAPDQPGDINMIYGRCRTTKEGRRVVRELAK